jgi:hypothetical protein
MRLSLPTARLPRMPLPRLEDIGAAMMAVPNPCGRSFESYLPQRKEERDARARH